MHNSKKCAKSIIDPYTYYRIFTDDNTSIMERIYIYYGISVGSNTFIMEHFPTISSLQ